MTRGIEAALWGNATRDADIRQSKAGNEFATINIIVHDGTTDESGRQVGTFIKVLAFSQHVATARGIKKGDRVYAEGQLQAGIWTTPDNTPRIDLTLKAFKLEKTGIGKNRPPRNHQQADFNAPIERETSREFDDAIPF
jgi:single-stranded DNA-binding protein